MRYEIRLRESNHSSYDCHEGGAEVISKANEREARPFSFPKREKWRTWASLEGRGGGGHSSHSRLEHRGLKLVAWDTGVAGDTAEAAGVPNMISVGWAIGARQVHIENGPVRWHVSRGRGALWAWKGSQLGLQGASRDQGSGDPAVREHRLKTIAFQLHSATPRTSHTGTNTSFITTLPVRQKNYRGTASPSDFKRPHSVTPSCVFWVYWKSMPLCQDYYVHGPELPLSMHGSLFTIESHSEMCTSKYRTMFSCDHLMQSDY